MPFAMGGSDAEVEVKAAAAEAEEEDTGTGADPTAGSRSSSPQLELEPQPQPQPQSQKEADSSGGNGDRKPQSVSGLASPGMVGLRLDSVENGEGAGEASQRPLTTSAAALASGGKPHHRTFHSAGTDGGEDKSRASREEQLAYKKARKRDDAEVIYVADIDMRSGMGSVSAADIVVHNHRRRVRVKGKSKRKKGKLVRRGSMRRRVRSGKVLDPEDDENEYMLTMGMMLGLRVAVGRQENPLENQELTIPDFYQVDKYVFPPSGGGGYLVTPSHKLGHTFKFKDYAPRVFKRIREHFGVDRMRYMLSVAGNYNFLDFIANAKSGEFFFFSHDERFMIKTMKPTEVKFLRRILPHYYKHVKQNPDTFLVRFYGMYRVKMHHLHRKVHFIVMNSVFDTYKAIHQKYDLKGSSLGRSANKGEDVFKDLDLVRDNTKIHLGTQREAFLSAIRADTDFLATMNIMDYSLLLGTHDRNKPVEEDTSPRSKLEKGAAISGKQRSEGVPDEGENTGAFEGEDAPGALHQDKDDDNRDEGQRQLSMESSVDSDEPLSPEDQDGAGVYWSDNGQGSSYTDEEAAVLSSGAEDEKASEDGFGLDENPMSRCSTFPHELASLNGPAGAEAIAMHEVRKRGGPGLLIKRRPDLGVDAMSSRGRKLPEIYFMGIIDILQEYNARKHAETAYKSLRHSKPEISCVDPVFYARRFTAFLEEHTD